MTSTSTDSGPLKGHLALVTGATGGIGRATCAALAAAGCDLAIHYHQASSIASSLAEDLSTAHAIRVESFQADLTSYDGTRALHNAVVTRLGHPSIVFLNAGSSSGLSGVKDVSEVSVEVFESTWRGNCGQTFLLTQLCLPAMVEKGWGRLVFNSSVAGFTGGVVGPHYASSKAALHGLIHWFASAYAKKGVTVNGVAPALITETSMLPEAKEELEKKIPVGRLGKPEEIADTVLWMVKNGYVTNKVIAVDGGMFIQ